MYFPRGKNKLSVCGVRIKRVSVQRGLKISVSWNTEMQFRRLRPRQHETGYFWNGVYFFRPHETSKSAHRNRNRVFLKPLSRMVWGPASTRIRETKYAILKLSAFGTQGLTVTYFLPIKCAGKESEKCFVGFHDQGVYMVLKLFH